LADHRLFLTVAEVLKKQILAAVLPRYLHILEDVDFGYSNVTSLTMLAHLQTCGVITPEDIESNRKKLTEPWNPDAPIEDLWQRLQEVQRYAAATHQAIDDSPVINLTLIAFKSTGIFTTTADKWRDRPDAGWTMANFQVHFTKANKRYT
jgi:hypothetical protein